MTGKFLYDTEVVVNTKIKNLGKGFGEIINEVSFGENPRQRINNQISLTQENQIKEALKSLGYIYLSEVTRERLREELGYLEEGAYDLSEIRDLLNIMLEGE